MFEETNVSYATVLVERGILVERAGMVSDHLLVEQIDYLGQTVATRITPVATSKKMQNMYLYTTDKNGGVEYVCETRGMEALFNITGKDFGFIPVEEPLTPAERISIPKPSRGRSPKTQQHHTEVYYVDTDIRETRFIDNVSSDYPGSRSQWVGDVCEAARITRGDVIAYTHQVVSIKQLDPQQAQWLIDNGLGEYKDTRIHSTAVEIRQRTDVSPNIAAVRKIQVAIEAEKAHKKEIARKVAKALNLPNPETEPEFVRDTSIFQVATVSVDVEGQQAFTMCIPLQGRYDRLDPSSLRYKGLCLNGKKQEKPLSVEIVEPAKTYDRKRRGSGTFIATPGRISEIDKRDHIPHAFDGADCSRPYRDPRIQLPGVKERDIPQHISFRPEHVEKEKASELVAWVLDKTHESLPGVNIRDIRINMCLTPTLGRSFRGEDMELVKQLLLLGMGSEDDIRWNPNYPREI